MSDEEWNAMVAKRTQHVHIVLTRDPMGECAHYEDVHAEVRERMGYKLLRFCCESHPCVYETDDEITYFLIPTESYLYGMECDTVTIGKCFDYEKDFDTAFEFMHLPTSRGAKYHGGDSLEMSDEYVGTRYEPHDIPEVGWYPSGQANG